MQSDGDCRRMYAAIHSWLRGLLKHYERKAAQTWFLGIIRMSVAT